MYLIKIEESGKLRKYYSLHSEEHEQTVTEIALRKLTQNLNVVRQAIATYETKIANLENGIISYLKQANKKCKSLKN